MRYSAWALAVVALSVSRGQVAQPAEELKKTIEKRCAKVSQISLAGGMFYTPRGSGSWGDVIEFRFNRLAKQLIIRFSGLPVLFVRNDRMYFLQWDAIERTSSDADYHWTYLAVKCDHTIAWKDLNAAAQLMRKESNGFGFSDACVYESFNPVLACLVAPFIDGGLDCLIPAYARPLPYDAKLLASDPEKAAEEISQMKLSEYEPWIFTLGHPDSMLMQSPVKKPKRLAPEKFPLCFEVKRDSSRLAYAFNRDSGVFLAVVGTVDVGTRGKEANVVAKMAVVREGDEYKPMPFELPKNAEIIGAADLKSFYRRRLSKIDLQGVRKDKADEDARIRELTGKEAELSAKLTRLSADETAGQKKREETRLELGRVQDEKAWRVYCSRQYQKVIDAMERSKSSQHP